MEKLVLVERGDLDNLMGWLTSIVENQGQVTRLRVCIDGDQVKLKIGESTWTPGFGELDPTCQEAQARRAPINSGNWNSRVPPC